jgi:hypothetical protein
MHHKLTVTVKISYYSLRIVGEIDIYGRMHLMILCIKVLIENNQNNHKILTNNRAAPAHTPRFCSDLRIHSTVVLNSDFRYLTLTVVFNTYFNSFKDHSL